MACSPCHCHQHLPCSPAAPRVPAPADAGAARAAVPRFPGVTDGFWGDLLEWFWFSFTVQEPLCMQNDRATGHGHVHFMDITSGCRECWAKNGLPLLQLGIIPPVLALQALGNSLTPTFLQSPFKYCKARTVGPQDLFCVQEQLEKFSFSAQLVPSLPLAELTTSPALNVLQECFCWGCPLLQPPL